MPGLTLPIGDGSAARRHLGAALSGLVRDLAKVPLQGGDDAAADARVILTRLAPLSRSQPGVVFSALRRPSVYTPLRLAADGGIDRVEHLRMGLATLACELAAAGALEVPLTLTSPPRRLLVRSRSCAIELDDGPVEISPTGALSQGGVRCAERRAFEPLSPAIALALADDNPLASLEAHPDKSGSALDLGPAPVSTWTSSLKDALARIERFLPALRDELETVLSVVVPVGVDAERHLSASYREALGVIYVSLHPDAVTMTEAVIHEAQHNKLNAALSTQLLLENAPDERYRSPVRPDARPILGVLLAVHAFVPVAHLYAAMLAAQEPCMATAQVRARVRTILEGNAEGLGVLEQWARPTPLGASLLQELRLLHDASVRALAPLA